MTELRRSVRFIVLLASLLLASTGLNTPAAGQSEPNPPAISANEPSAAGPPAGTADLSKPGANEDYVISVETDLVVLHATVTDKNGRPVADLKQNEFRVF